MKYSYFSNEHIKIKSMSISLAEGKALVRGILVGIHFQPKGDC